MLIWKMTISCLFTEQWLAIKKGNLAPDARRWTINFFEISIKITVFQWTLFDFGRIWMLSLKGMLIKRFINICSQKRSCLKFFDFLTSLLKYNSSTMLSSSGDITDKFFTKCQYRENKNNFKYRYHFNKNYNW